MSNKEALNPFEIEVNNSDSQKTKASAKKKYSIITFVIFNELGDKEL